MEAKDDSPFKERVEDLRGRIKTMKEHNVRLGSASTPISKVYKDFAVYEREAARLQRISEEISQQVQEAPTDEESLQALRKELKKASPPAFMKNSWYDAAIKEQSAQTTIGTPIPFSKLMKDPAFRAYSRVANSIEEGLNL